MTGAFWRRFLPALGLLALSGPAGAATHLGVFGIAESASCSGDCGSAVDEQSPSYGGSFLFTGRFDDWGLFLEMGGTNRAPFAGLGAIRWFGPVRVMVGPYILTRQARYDFADPFPSTEASDQATALSAELAVRGFFLRYQRYSYKVSFESSIPDPNNSDATLTRNAASSFDVDFFALGYRYRFW
ncbi:hypothetical protein [Thiohalorhabdus methylotrophus]|uniref:Outer membrane protein beta-barrel domain-containing protein n=1 Tax=Thiohalorhabdus methylotrophus TaxID=3242694 RepID=A0ABV4TTP5_9GAMM